MLHVLWLTQFLYMSSEAIPTDEQRLLDKLLKDYNPASRPVYNASDTVTVHFGITLTQLSDMVSVDYFHYFFYICYIVDTLLFNPSYEQPTVLLIR